MKKYEKPIIDEEIIEIADIIMESITQTGILEED